MLQTVYGKVNLDIFRQMIQDPIFLLELNQISLFEIELDENSEIFQKKRKWMQHVVGTF